jgi:hypothetical protein
VGRQLDSQEQEADQEHGVEDSSCVPSAARVLTAEQILYTKADTVHKGSENGEMARGHYKDRSQAVATR